MQIGILCGLLAGAFWGLVFIAPRLLPAFSPLELVVGRYAAYGLIALVASLVVPQFRAIWTLVDRHDCRAMIRQSLAGNIVYYLLLAYGVQLAGVAPTSLIIGVLPLLVTLMGRRDHGAVSLRSLAPALGLVVLGIACINVDIFSFVRSQREGSILQTLIGILCAIGALFCWSWYTIDNTRYLKAHSKFSGGQWATLYGLMSGAIALVIAVVMLALHVWNDSGAPRDWQLFWQVNIAVAIGASLVGNQLWNVASRLVPVTLSGQLIVFETLFALLYGFVYDHRLPRVLEWTAMALLMAGVAWAVRKHAVAEAPVVLYQ